LLDPWVHSREWTWNATTATVERVAGGFRGNSERAGALKRYEMKTTLANWQFDFDK
jgi:hypothetical protein